MLFFSWSITLDLNCPIIHAKIIILGVPLRAKRTYHFFFQPLAGVGESNNATTSPHRNKIGWAAKTFIHSKPEVFLG
jgi:hypothetical protein